MLIEKYEGFIIRLTPEETVKMCMFSEKLKAHSRQVGFSKKAIAFSDDDIEMVDKLYSLFDHGQDKGDGLKEYVGRMELVDEMEGAQGKKKRKK